MFWAQGGQNEANGTKNGSTSCDQIFHEHAVNDINCFWAHKAEMSLRTLTSCNQLHQERKLESSVLGTGGKMSQMPVKLFQLI